MVSSFLWVTYAVHHFFWWLFKPGILSSDSIRHYSDALRGSYHTVHPILIPWIISIFLRIGLGLASITFIQISVGVIGIFLFSKRISDLTLSDSKKERSSWIALFTTALLLSPLTPLPYHLVTLWKDTWFAIMLLWIGILTVEIFHLNQMRRNKRKIILTLILIVLASIAVQFRHNAITILPIISLFIFLISRKSTSKLHLSIITILPFIISASIALTSKKFLPIKQNYPFNQIMATDLVGLSFQNPKLLEQFPFTLSYIKDPEWRETFQYGNVPDIIRITKRGGSCDAVYYSTSCNIPELKKEWKYAVVNYPFQLALVKLKSFLSLVYAKDFPWHGHIKLHPRGQKLGLKWNPKNKSIRDRFIKISNWVQATPIINAFSAFHSLWILTMLSILGFFYFMPLNTEILNSLKNIRPLYVFLPTLSLSYVGSYLVAVATYDFRYLYPSTLFIQVVFLASTMTIFCNYRYLKKRKKQRKNVHKK